MGTEVLGQMLLSLAGPMEEVPNELELLEVIRAELLVAHPDALSDGLPDGFDEGGRGRDAHTSPVGGVGVARDVAGLLEPIDQSGDGAGGQPQGTGNLPVGVRAVTHDEVQAAQVGTADTEIIGEGPVAIVMRGLELSQLLTHGPHERVTTVGPHQHGAECV